MAIDVQPEITIARARPTVAAFMFEPRNDAIWTTGVVECRPLTDGPLRAGSRVLRVTKFLGRTFSYEYVVIEAEIDRFVEIRVEKPFPMAVRYQLDDLPGGTRVSIRARGDATGFFRLAAPLMAPMVRRNISRDLGMLKQHLEATPAR